MKQLYEVYWIGPDRTVYHGYVWSESAGGRKAVCAVPVTERLLCNACILRT